MDVQFHVKLTPMSIVPYGVVYLPENSSNNPVELTLMEPNPDKVIYYVSQYRFLLNMYNDKVSVKLI